MSYQQQFIRSSFLTLCIPFTLLFGLPSNAGVDMSCEPSTQVDGHRYNSCDNLPVLSPANDNRTNILLLLSDMGLAKINIEESNSTLWMTNYSKVPFEFSNIIDHSTNKLPNARSQITNPPLIYNEHCISLKSGAQAFIQQVKTDTKLSNTEKDILIRERQKIAECTDKLNLITVNSNWSVPTRQYASYLNATISFYNANFSTATKIYSVLTSVDQAWLKETSQYMLIRSSLDEAYQSGVREYGDLDHNKLNQNLLSTFFNNITQYFKLYPQGQYAASARGYLRRGFWLSGKHDLLINEYVWQINNPKSRVYNLEIPNLPYEIDRRVFQSKHFHVKNLKDPFFLSIYDLMHMREKQSDDDIVISWAELNAQKNYFKDQPELFHYLQANHLFYVQNKAQEALKYLPQQAPSSINSYLQLSQLLLKGRILEASGQNQATQQYWENLLSISKTAEQRGLAELMLYPYYAKLNNAALFVGKLAKIKQASLQKSFIENIANERSLMSIIQDQTAQTDQKNLAINTILQKSLIHQNYNLFNQAYALLPKNAAQYIYNNEKFEHYKNQPPLGDFVWKGTKISHSLQCPDLYTLTQKLEKSPQDLTLRLCLGEYIRSEQGYSVHHQTYVEKDQTSFQGTVFTRGQVYKDIMKQSADPKLKAYALYRSIMCYSPNGTNDCQDQDVVQSVRKQWFNQIKRDYPDTSWAKSLKYYW
ncbi:hypothetical protein [Acinetobacter sp. YH12069]|uniref:hypothetical protein n=1 Tax=unclassified Acinetobacter TaxID=196816 RepID=UPI0035A07CBC